MKSLRRTCAVAILSLTLALSAFAGTIHSPGKAEPTPTSSVATMVILTILSLIR